jgi:hypothetical protein
VVFAVSRAARETPRDRHLPVSFGFGAESFKRSASERKPKVVAFILFL